MERGAVIAAGFGFRSGATLASLRLALASAQLGNEPVEVLATAQDKLNMLLPLAEALGLRCLGLSPATLSAVATPTRSQASMAARHTGSVAEASALAAAGPGARLLCPRRISADRMAACAIAQGFTK